MGFKAGMVDLPGHRSETYFGDFKVCFTKRHEFHLGFVFHAVSFFGWDLLSPAAIWHWKTLVIDHRSSYEGRLTPEGQCW